MTARVVVLGGGVGGTIVANRLGRRNDVEVTLLDNHGRHLFQPGLVGIPFSGDSVEKLERPEYDLLRDPAQLRVGRAKFVNVAKRQVELEDGTLDYDWLVVATGSRVFHEDIPGLREHGRHFHCAKAVLKLRQRLLDFKGGRIVVGAASLPYKCPPSVVEFTLLLDEWLRERKIRSRTEIAYTYPTNGVFARPEAEGPIRRWFKERDIRIETSFEPDSVSPNSIIAKDGRMVDFDLLIMVPPHRGAPFLRNSMLAGPTGFIPADSRTLRVCDRVYALGDTAGLPVPKSGAAAHAQAPIVAENIASEIEGGAPQEHYDGSVACFLETGGHRAALMKMDYAHPLPPPSPSRFAYWRKRLFKRLYFKLMRRA